MKVNEFLKLSAEEMTSCLLKKREIYLKAAQDAGFTTIYAVSKCAEPIKAQVARYLISLETGLTAEESWAAEENFEKAYQTVFPDALPMHDERIEMEKKIFRESEGIKAWWLQLSEEDRVKLVTEN